MIHTQINTQTDILISRLETIVALSLSAASTSIDPKSQDLDERETSLYQYTTRT